jgi:hypothetical protein
MWKAIAIASISALMLCAAPASQTFTGVITDDMCGKDKHGDMKMGADEKCVVECVKQMNAKYVLKDGENIYVLSDQKTPEKFAAKKVTVTGTLDDQTKTIKVEKIEAAK